MASSSSEDCLTQRVDELQKQLGKKQKFEEAVSSIRTLLQQSYPSASPSLRQKVLVFPPFFTLSRWILFMAGFAWVLRDNLTIYKKEDLVAVLVNWANSSYFHLEFVAGLCPFI